MTKKRLIRTTFTEAEREAIARVIHEQYVAEQQEQGVTVKSNPSVAPWDKLPEALRESNRQQADDIPRKLASIKWRIGPKVTRSRRSDRLTNKEIEKLAQMEHERWVKEKLDAGWRLGREKDAKKKTHPSLVEWDQLPESEIENDRHAVRSIPSLLARVGLKPYRTGSRTKTK